MAPTATAVPPKTRINVPTSSASAAGRIGSLVLLPYAPSLLSSSSLSTTPSLAARRMSSLVMRCPAVPWPRPSAMPGPEAGMSGPRPRARSPPARCTSTASRSLPGSTGLPSSSVLPLSISLLPPFQVPEVSLVDNLLVFGTPLLGTLLVATVLLGLFGAHRLLGGFHRLASGLPGEHPHDRTHDDVAHAAHLASPPPALRVLDLGAPTGHLRRRALSGRLPSTSSLRRSTSTSTTIL